MPTEIDSLQIKIETQSSNAAKGIEDLIVSLGKLKNVKYGNELQKLSVALRPLSNLKLTGFKNAMDGLAKVPNISKSLDASTINAFATSCNKLSTALSPLAEKMAQVGGAFSVLPSVVKKTTQAMDAYSKEAEEGATSSGKFGNILDDVRTKIGGITVMLHQAGQTVGQWINNSNDYIENVNLFTVSMGEYAGEAMEYAKRINELMGVDLSEFIRNQGIFMSMATGFGLASDKAYEMSKGLTELSYDLSSFFNISLDAVGDGAFAKVQSGIAGELEPLRRLGFALSEASLQEVAYAHGIDLSIEKMTESQKAMLRYTAMVEQAADMGAIGDMARTLITPSNAIRILKQQFTELTRALGNLFIPILIKVLPYLQALTKVLTTAIQKLAVFFGFEMPTIDYSGMDKVSDSAVSTSEGLGEAAENAKKLKSQMLGIDELNVISKDEGSSAGAGGASGNGYGSDLGLDVSSIWDESILSKIESDVDSLIPKMEKLAKVLGIVSGALVSIKIGGWIKQLATFLGGTTLFANLKKFASALKETKKFLPAISTAFPGLASALTTLGGGSLGLGLGIVAAAIVAIGLAIYYAKENFDLVKATFSDFFDENIAPKIDEIKESFQHMGEVLKPIGDFFKPIIDSVKKFSKEVLGIKSLGDVFEFIGGVIFHTLGGIVAGAFSAAMNMIKGFVKIIEGSVDIVAGVVKIIVGIFKGDFTEVKEAVSQVIDGVKKVFEGLWDTSMIGYLTGFVGGVVDYFESLWKNIMEGDGAIPKLMNDISAAFELMWKNTVQWFAKNVAPKFTREFWIKTLDGLKTGFIAMLDIVKSVISGKWDGIKDWFNTSVKPWFTKEKWTSLFSGIKEGFSQVIKDALNNGIEKLNEFIGWVNDKLSFEIKGKSIGGQTIPLPEPFNDIDIPKIKLWEKQTITLATIPQITKRYADGGFIEDGLFTMNRGEIAGKFNNGKSVVANNEQIIAGISEGVYSAVVAAMRNAGGSNGEQNVNVYLDGKQIYSSVKKTETERGKQLFGNQLGYNF